MFNELIDTPYGKAYVFGKTSDGDFVVSLPKKNMHTVHPSYRGGPCVCFILEGKKK